MTRRAFLTALATALAAQPSRWVPVPGRQPDRLRRWLASVPPPAADRPPRGARWAG